MNLGSSGSLGIGFSKKGFGFKNSSDPKAGIDFFTLNGFGIGLTMGISFGIGLTMGFGFSIGLIIGIGFTMGTDFGIGFFFLLLQ